MRLEQLTAMREIVRHTSLRSACENLHMTQQALSSSIKSMENELGVLLLHRSRQGVTLTDNGKKVLAFADDVEPKYSALLESLRSGRDLAQSETLRGTLQIYVNSLFYLSMLSNIIKLFCEKHTQLKVVTLGAPPATICARLKEPVEDGVYRIGLLNVPCTPTGELHTDFISGTGLSFHPLAQGSYHACVGKTSTLAQQRELSLRVLLKHPLVVGAADEFNVTPLHYLLTRYGSPNIVLSTDSLSLWSHSIVNNVGVGFLHDIFLNGAEPFRTYLENIALIKIKEKLNAVTGYVLSGEPDDAVRTFITFLPGGRSGG